MTALRARGHRCIVGASAAELEIVTDRRLERGALMSTFAIDSAESRALRSEASADSATMRAAVFVAPGRLELRDVPRPTAGPGEAVVRVTLTTICGTDVHILKGEYPIRSGHSAALRRKTS